MAVAHTLVASLVLCWCVAGFLRVWVPPAMAFVHELRPFMPLAFLALYLYRSHVAGGATAWHLLSLVGGVIVWWSTGHDDDDRWKRRRRRLAGRVRVATGGRKLVTA